MDLKICSDSEDPRSVCLLLLMAALIALSACAEIQPVPQSEQDTGRPPPEIVGTPGNTGQARAPDSRMLAAHSLTREGYRLLQKNDYDGAIRTLEQAVGINPGDGPACFYLAEAWLGKKNFHLAAQFNGLATIYLRSDPAWFQRAKSQKKRIDQGTNEM